MKVTDPKPYLDAIDRVRLREILGQMSKDGSSKVPIYVEPSSQTVEPQDETPKASIKSKNASSINTSKTESTSKDIKRGKIQVLGDFIDTDAVRFPSYPVPLLKYPPNINSSRLTTVSQSAKRTPNSANTASNTRTPNSVPVQQQATALSLPVKLLDVALPARLLFLPS